MSIPVYTRPDWHADANCRGMDPELFFPGQGESTKEAKAVCRACDVQVECLLAALNNTEKHGIWGGKSERERRAIQRGQPVAPPQPRQPPKCGTNSGYEGHRKRGEVPCDDCKAAHSVRSWEYQKRRKAAQSAA